MTTTLFVYGTLLSGEKWHYEMGGLSPISDATTRAEYTLVALDGYPGLLEGGTTAVRGELYAVPDEELARLDRFEGAEYVRKAVQLESGRAAQAYVLAPDRDWSDRRVLEVGDWRLCKIG